MRSPSTPPREWQQTQFREPPSTISSKSFSASSSQATSGVKKWPRKSRGSAGDEQVVGKINIWGRSNPGTELMARVSLLLRLHALKHGRIHRNFTEDNLGQKSVCGITTTLVAGYFITPGPLLGTSLSTIKVKLRFFQF